MKLRILPSALVLAILLCSTAPQTAAQAPLPPEASTAASDVLNFAIEVSNTFQFVSIAASGQGPGGSLISQQANFDITIRDESYDTGSVNPATEARTVNYHNWEITFDWKDGIPVEGWQLLDNKPFIPYTVRGDSYKGSVGLQTTLQNTVRVASATLTVTMYKSEDPSIRITQSENFTAIVYPAPALQLRIDSNPATGAPIKAAPNKIVPIPVEITNADLYPQQVDVSLQIAAGENINPETIPVIGAGTYYLGPLETLRVVLEIRTPKDTTWYRGSPLVYDVVARNSQQESVSISAGSVMTIEGFYWSTPLLVVIPILLLLLVLFVLMLLIGKRYYDEKILGKPIPPWRIPEEAAALEKARKDNPREFYITRYFLMEEEYQSALNWFHSYKKRSKKQLRRSAKSDLLVDRAAALKSPAMDRFDQRAERIKRKIHRRQQRRRLKLEAKLEKIQEKVDKNFEADYAKAHEKWEKKVEKLKAKANRPWARDRSKWEREVERTMAKWEKPFAKDKAKREKEIAKAKERYAAQVKKQDKETWREWKEAVASTEEENRIREREDREPLPLPELTSTVVPPPEFPKPFKLPPKPKLPPEPVEPVVKDLPPEPVHERRLVDDSMRKVRRAKKKTERKVRRLERKKERMLAKNERDRVKALAKAGKKREKLLRKSHRLVEPTLMERLFRQTPEHRERRAHKKLLKALAKERLSTYEESEKSRLDVMKLQAEREEAELTLKLVRSQGEVRKSSGSSAMQVEEAPELVELRERNEERLAKEKLNAKAKIEAQRKQIERQLREQLTEELVLERQRAQAARDARDKARLARQEAKAASAKDDKAEKEDDAAPTRAAAAKPRKAKAKS